MYRSRSVLLWPSCIITRLNCRSSVSVTSGTRPTIPSACLSASVKAVDLLSDGSWSNSTPYLLVAIDFPSVFLLFHLCWHRTRCVWFASAGFCNVRVDHLCRIDDAVELVFRYKSQLECGLLER